MLVHGMLCKATRPLFILLLYVAVHANALPLQYLPEIPGYIPVYIRVGDQPLEEINPTIAKAFREPSDIIKNIRKLSMGQLQNNQVSSKNLTDKSDNSFDPKGDIMNPRHFQLAVPSKQLIYNLPLQTNNFTEDIKYFGKNSYDKAS